MRRAHGPSDERDGEEETESGWDNLGSVPWRAFAVAAVLRLLVVDAYRSTDFDVHRNWLAITYSLPLSQWYYDATSEWTLDYPPFFAYFEWLLAQAGALVDPAMVVVRSEPYQSPATVLFQRLTVIASDVVLAAATAACFAAWDPARRSKRDWTRAVLACVVLILNPGLFLVDGIHFQYNGMLLGILLFSVALVWRGRDLAAAATFAALLMFKHIFLYTAPVYFVYLLRHACFTSRTRFWGAFDMRAFVRVAAVTLAVLAAGLGPFAAHLPQLAARLFPFKRGLCHAYWAPNVWAVYNVVDMVAARVLRVGGAASVNAMTRGTVGDHFDHVVLPRVTPAATIALTLAAMLPALVRLWNRPTAHRFVPVMVYTTLCSFLFGWHVHEKAILIAIVPLTVVAFHNRRLARIYTLLSIAGHVSLLPLIFTPLEQGVKLAAVALHASLVLAGLGRIYAPSEPASGRAPAWYAGIGQVLSRVDALLLAGLVAAVVLAEFVLPLVLPAFAFLPLMLLSLSCAVVIVYATGLLTVYVLEP